MPIATSSAEPDQQFEERLECLEKKEAMIYYFESEKDFNETYARLISFAQDSFSPEISLLFYNGDTSRGFSKKVEERIDDVIQNYFVEYLREDLNKQAPMPGYQAMADDDDQPKQGPAGSLLSGVEKVGIERLIESLQCCMWSSMVKKKAPI